MKKWVAVLLVFILSLVVKSNSWAIPTLQLYIEGSTYDAGTDTWTTNLNNFKIWVIGEEVQDVQLAIAHAASESGLITLTSTNATGIVDPSIPIDPVFRTNSATTGYLPLLGDGSALPAHGIYGAETTWESYSLGDFNLNDSLIGDYIGGIPTSYPRTGQINAYSVSVPESYSWVHFDAYDHIEGKNHSKYIFAPFSHDGESSGSSPVPEPATMVMLGVGVLGLFALRKKA